MLHNFSMYLLYSLYEIKDYWRKGQILDQIQLVQLQLTVLLFLTQLNHVLVIYIPLFTVSHFFFFKFCPIILFLLRFYAYKQFFHLHLLLFPPPILLYECSARLLVNINQLMTPTISTIMMPPHKRLFHIQATLNALYQASTLVYKTTSSQHK